MALDNDDWQSVGHDMPLLVDMPAGGTFLGEDFFRAGGVPAVIGELLAARRRLHRGALT